MRNKRKAGFREMFKFQISILVSIVTGNTNDMVYRAQTFYLA